MEDLHDLGFAAGEVRRLGSRHGVSGVKAKKFAHSEYIRATTRLSSEAGSGPPAPSSRAMRISAGPLRFHGGAGCACRRRGDGRTRRGAPHASIWLGRFESILTADGS
jgi:hypothetical protein